MTSVRPKDLLGKRLHASRGGGLWLVTPHGLLDVEVSARAWRSILTRPGSTVLREVPALLGLRHSQRSD